jgi:uncharacterized protein involved in exopolysaccharide biosynthesis
MREISREQSFGDVLSEIWRGKWFIAFGFAFAMAAAAGFIVLAVPHTEARMVIAPASPMEAMQGAERVGQNRVKPQSTADMNFTRFESVFRGASAAKLLLRDEMIRGGIENDKAFRFQDDDREWNAAKLSEYITRRVHVDPVGESALRVLSYEHENPAFAAVFLRKLHETADGLIRYSMRKDVNERIAYLQMALGKTLNPEHRRALTDLLMEQERLKMLVSIEQPYAAAVVETAYPMTKRSWPNVPLVVAGFGLSGAFLGFIVFSIRNAMRAEMTLAERQERVFQEELDLDVPLSAHQRRIQEWIRRDSLNNNEKPMSGRNRRRGDAPFSEAAE